MKVPAAIAAAALFAAGVLAAHRFEGLYEFAWSHPSVMLLGQFALLALGAFTRPWMLAAFWVFSGATAFALVLRAAAALHSGLLAALVAFAAVVVALALFARLRRELVGGIEAEIREAAS